VKTAILNLKQWTCLKNYAATVTDFFKTSVIPSNVHSFIRFVTYSNIPPVIVLGNEVALKAKDWKALENSFESIDSYLKLVCKLDDLDVNHLINSVFHNELRLWMWGQWYPSPSDSI
jgi:hypothetical protein